MNTVSRKDSSSARAPYYFRLKYDDVAGITEVLLNGFPVEQAGGSITDNPVLPLELTAALVDDRNRLIIRVEPRILRGRSTNMLSTVKLHGHVTRRRMGGQLISGSQVTTAEVDSAHWSWTDRAKNRWQEYRSETTTSRQALDSIRAWADRNPMTVSTTFDNEAGPDFSDIFEEAPVISDTSRLKDYAMHLRDLMAERDTAALFEEFRPSIMDRFEMRSFESRARYIEENRNAVVLEGAILDFDRDDVRVRRWVDGRVWEIWWAGSENEAFFERPSGYGTGELYVAEVDGTLRVVR